MHHLTVPEIKVFLSCTPEVVVTTKGRPSKTKVKGREVWARLMLLVGFSHGLRVSELINLTTANVSDGYVSVKRLKKSEPTIQPFKTSQDPDLDESIGIRALVLTLKSGDRLFPVNRHAVAYIMTRAGIKAGFPRHLRHPHVLKHSCAMATLEVCKINEVQRYLGHKSLSSTGKYLVVSDEVASKAVSGAW